MMKPCAAQRTVFDDHHFQSFVRRQERRLAASRSSTYDRKLIFFVHIAYRALPSTRTAAPHLLFWLSKAKIGGHYLRRG